MSFLDKIFKIKDEKEINGLTPELKSLYIYQKFKKTEKSILVVTPGLNEASKIYNSLTHYTDKVWFFPMDDFLTSEAIAISPEFKTSRLETINKLINYLYRSLSLHLGQQKNSNKCYPTCHRQIYSKQIKNPLLLLMLI